MKSYGERLLNAKSKRYKFNVAYVCLKVWGTKPLTVDHGSWQPMVGCMGARRAGTARFPP